MTFIYNTTPISEKIIRNVIEIVKPDCPPVNSLSLRNKQEGTTHGNWGRFYPQEYKITLCVPQIKLLKELKGKRKYTHKEFLFSNDLDFLATVIGHEYYHAWQWINEPELWHCNEYLEVGAEKYETTALNKWKDYLNEIGVMEAIK